MTRPKVCCCNPLQRPNHRGIFVEKASALQIQNIKAVNANFVSSGIVYLCIQCRKAIKQKKTPVVKLKRGTILSAIVQGIRRRSPNTLLEARKEFENQNLAENQSNSNSKNESNNLSKSVPSTSKAAAITQIDFSNIKVPTMALEEEFTINRSTDVGSEASKDARSNLYPEIEFMEDIFGDRDDVSSMVAASTITSIASSRDELASVITSIYDPTTPHEIVDASLAAIGSTPFKKEKARSRTYIKDKSLEAQKNLVEQFRSVAKVDITPRTLISQECKHCDRLVQGLIRVFPKLTTKSEKYLALTSTPLSMTLRNITESFKCSSYMSKLANRLRKAEGPFSKPLERKVGHYKVTVDVIERIRSFYLRPENGQIQPGIRQTIQIKDTETGQKSVAAKHHMFMSQSELYIEFCKEHQNVEISLSTFAMYKPKQCKWPGKVGFQKTCMCEHHQNFHLLLNSIGINVDSKVFLENVLCVPPQEVCFLKLCTVCPIKERTVEYCRKFNISKTITDITDIRPHISGTEMETEAGNELGDMDDEEDEIHYSQWIKEERISLKQLLASRGEIYELILDKLPDFANHHFLLHKQNEYFKTLRDKIKDENSMIVHMDFAENYSFVVGEEVQGFHWNNCQMTIHPFYCIWNDDEGNENTKTFVVLSDCLEHNATVIEAFRRKFMESISVSNPNLQKIYWVSDGTGAQYKNYKNFVNTSQYKTKYGIDSEIHFTVSYHGKSECDAASANTKRSLRLASVRDRRHIICVDDAYNYCKEKLSDFWHEYVLVSRLQVDDIVAETEALYATAKTIPGSRGYHSFIIRNDGMVETRSFSSSEHVKIHKLVRDTALENPEAEEVGVDIQHQDIANDALLDISAYHLGGYVAFILNRTLKLGLITSINSEENFFNVIPMSRVGKGNTFRKTKANGEILVPYDDMISTVTNPISKDQITFKLEEEEFRRVKQSFQDRNTK